MIEETAMPSGVCIEGQAFWEKLGTASLKFHHPVGGIASGSVGVSVGFLFVIGVRNVRSSWFGVPSVYAHLRRVEKGDLRFENMCAYK